MLKIAIISIISHSDIGCSYRQSYNVNKRILFQGQTMTTKIDIHKPYRGFHTKNNSLMISGGLDLL